MPIQGDVKNLYSDREKTRALFPTTKVSAVSDDNGVGLDALMENLLYSGIEVPETSSVPLNADTLEGHPASDFATPSFVTSEIAKAQLSGGSGGDIDLSGFATKDDVNNAVRAIDYPVDSVNGKTGAVELSASDVGAHPNTWLPTIEQIGAAPSGYGLGGSSPVITDLNNAINNGWYGAASGTLNIPPVQFTEYSAVFVIRRQSDDITQILFCNALGGRQWIRHLYGQTWSEWVECSPSAFAPAGVVSKTIRIASESELDNALTEEINTMANDSTRFLVFAPKTSSVFGGVAVLCRLYKRSDSGYGTADFISYATYGPNTWQKSWYGGVWQPLEYVNPPMQVGTEYRTTKRCEGKAVYAKRINCYAAPASVSISNLNIEKVVRWSGFVTYYGVALPCSSANWKVEINRNSISTTSAYDQTSAHFYIDLYYTKS